LARRLAAVVPAAAAVPLNTVYGVTAATEADARALAAWLNTRWLTALARLRADRARGDYRRFNARIVGELPIPPLASPAWPRLAALGATHTTDDALVADTLELDARDRGLLTGLASDPR
jgi:hypothetical protein